MRKHLLNGQWMMRGNGYEVNGLVPGSVYSFLYLDNALLPNPHYRDNEDLYLELINHEYTFEKAFVYTPTQQMTESIVTEVTQNLTRIRHHACLGLICGNNEIEWHFHEYVAISGRADGEHKPSLFGFV